MLNSTIENLNARGDAWAVWLGTSILDAAIVLALAAVLWTIVRKRASVQLGYCLFLLVLVKLLVPLEVAVPPQLAQWTPGHILSTAWTLPKASKNAVPAEVPERETQSPAIQPAPQPVPLLTLRVTMDRTSGPPVLSSCLKRAASGLLERDGRPLTLIPRLPPPLGGWFAGPV